LFRNQGDNTFVDVGYLTGANRIEDGRGVAIADFDQNGQLDILMVNFARPAVLLMGSGATGHWLEIELRGATANTDAVGAVATVVTAAGTHTRDVARGEGFLSSSSPVLHFGLGATPTIERLEIRWPSGRHQVVTGIKADRRLRIQEPPLEPLQAPTGPR
jgi:enediyne biosynthesis protein E4